MADALCAGPGFDLQAVANRPDQAPGCGVTRGGGHQGPPLVQGAVGEGHLECDDGCLQAVARPHAWLQSIEWDNIRLLKPPFVPALKDAEDTSNFPELDVRRWTAKLFCWMGAWGLAPGCATSRADMADARRRVVLKRFVRHASLPAINCRLSGSHTSGKTSWQWTVGDGWLPWPGCLDLLTLCAHNLTPLLRTRSPQTLQDRPQPGRQWLGIPSLPLQSVRPPLTQSIRCPLECQHGGGQPQQPA